MHFLSRLKFSMKLGLMTAAGLVGMAVFALVAYTTLRQVCINSAMFQDISLAYNLAGDSCDPPASLVAALPHAIAAEDASTPEDTAKSIALLRQAHQDFEESNKRFQQVLPSGSIRSLMRTESYPSGEEWFNVAEQEFIPALLAGDHDRARKIRIEKNELPLCPPQAGQ